MKMTKRTIKALPKSIFRVQKFTFQDSWSFCTCFRGFIRGVSWGLLGSPGVPWSFQGPQAGDPGVSRSSPGELLGSPGGFLGTSGGLQGPSGNLLVPPGGLLGPSTLQNVCSRLSESAYFAKSTFGSWVSF